MAAAPLADRLRSEIREHGLIAVSRYVDAALYDPEHGFYSTVGKAGRSGDFITAPEVGPLFGAVISNAVDAWWDEAGRPSQFTVAEHGAGPGTLARTVTLADGECLRAGALRWVMVERSDRQRDDHPTGEHLMSVDPTGVPADVDVVLANELLDNLPFDIVAHRADGWVERRIALDGDEFVLVDGDPVPPPVGADSAAHGIELPVATQAVAWVRAQRESHPNAAMVVIDYAAPTRELADRDGGWLRAYRDHARVDDWLNTPGECDITIDLPTEQITASGGVRAETQAEFLRRNGIDHLVEEGQLLWRESAQVGDLAALRARSRVAEAEALLDPAGMGAFTVFESGYSATTT